MKQVIKSVMSNCYDILLESLSGCLSDFANKMLSKQLITETVMKKAEFNDIIGDYKAGMSTIFKYTELQEYCSKLLDVLRSLGGPAKRAADHLESELNKSFQAEFEHCLFPQSRPPDPSCPTISKFSSFVPGDKDHQISNPLSTTLPPPQQLSSHPMQPFLPPGPPFLLPHDAASVPACYIYYSVYYSVRENSSLQQNIDYQPHSNPQERLHSQPNEETPNQINSPPPHVDLEDYTSKATPSEYQDKTPHFVTIKPQESYVHSNSDASNYNLPSLPEEDMYTLSIEKINHHQHPNFSTPTSSEQCDNAYSFANETSGQPKDEMVLTSVTPGILLPKEVEAEHTTEYRLSRLEIQMKRLIQSSYFKEKVD